MITPIRCFTCGMPLDDKAELYQHFKRQKNAEMVKKLGIVEKSLDLDPRVNVKMEDILDKLQIKKCCCRTHLATVMHLADFY